MRNLIAYITAAWLAASKEKHFYSLRLFLRLTVPERTACTGWVCRHGQRLHFVKVEQVQLGFRVKSVLLLDWATAFAQRQNAMQECSRDLISGAMKPLKPSNLNRKWAETYLFRHLL